jgi:dipeptidase E
MKLYLSSNRVGANPQALRELVGGAGRAALVLNALDGYGAERPKNLDREASDIAALGFECEELDLREYFRDSSRLRDRLGNVDLVWVVGGNTFVLARAMTESRFGDAIHEAIFGERIVYAGYSAGVCVTGPDLDGCHLMDEPDVVPAGYSRDTEPTTLGWLPWRIIPHWRSDHDEAPLAETAVEHLLEAGLPFQTLKDGQAFVIDGDVRFLA